tara:strand:+ start:291 stop:1052 length:762 start_codon:yes stop_codon:yes gene_type:complete
MTTEGQFAKGWGTGVGSTKSGTQAGWKLIKDDPDPRKRVWQLYQNGKPVPGKTKTGSLTIGGNLAEWGKGGVKNVSNFAQAFDIRDRVADEGKPSPSNINEYFNSILQERWDNAVTEDEKSSVKDLLAAFNLEEQKGIITEETGAGTTSVIPESFSEYRGRTAGEIVQDDVTIPPSEKEVTKVESGVLKKGEPEEVKEPPMMSIADLEKWELDTRDTTPAGKAFGEEGALQRMAIRRRHLENRGTIFEDNVRD